MWKYIRKFGLQYYDLPTMLWNISFFLRALTLNIDSRYKKGIPILSYIVTGFSFLCYIYIYLFSVLWFVFVRSPQTGDLVSATVVLSLGISSEIGTVKLLYMFLYIKKIRKLTEDYLELDSQTVLGSRFSKNLMKKLKNVKKRVIFYWMLVMGSCTVYITKPIVTPGKHLTEDLYVIYGLEPMFESPNFEIAWVTMACSILLMCYISANVTGYLVIITGYAESQMLALSEELTHVWEDAKDYVKNINNGTDRKDVKDKLINEHVSASLKDIMKRHATIKTLLGQIEDVFRSAIAVGFIFLILGLISELLGELENTYLQVPYAFIQVSVDCYMGQKVIDACEIFERAVYDCQWENFDKNNMKMVLVMLQNSQKTAVISAGGITEMSYRFMMVAMKATYSAYTALRSVFK